MPVGLGCNSSIHCICTLHIAVQSGCMMSVILGQHTSLSRLCMDAEGLMFILRNKVHG